LYWTQNQHQLHCSGQRHQHYQLPTNKRCHNIHTYKHASLFSFLLQVSDVLFYLQTHHIQSSESVLTISLLTTTSRTTWVIRHQKGKPFWMLREQQMMGWQRHQLDYMRLFAPCSRQITMPVPYHSVFTGQMPFLPPNQQRQSTEGTNHLITNCRPYYRIRNQKPTALYIQNLKLTEECCRSMDCTCARLAASFTKMDNKMSYQHQDE